MAPVTDTSRNASETQAKRAGDPDSGAALAAMLLHKAIRHSPACLTADTTLGAAAAALGMTFEEVLNLAERRARQRQGRREL